MSKNESLVRQGTILALASLIVRFIGFLYRIPLTEMIGDEGIAIYSASFNIYTLFLIISSQGLPTAVAKLVSEQIENDNYYNAHKIFKRTMYLAIILGLISSSVLFFGAVSIENIINTYDSRYSIRVLAPAVFIVAIMAVFRGYFQGMKNTVPTAISQIFEQIINAIISIYFAYLLVQSTSVNISVAGRGAMGGTFGTLFGALAGLIALITIYLLSRPKIKKNITDNNKEAYTTKYIFKSVLQTAVPIIIGTAIFSITNIIDNMMIMERLVTGAGFEIQEATVLYGQYSGKYTVISNLPISIATSFAIVGVPFVASLNRKGDKQALNDKINSIIRIAMILCIPASFGIAVLSDNLLTLLYPTYSDGGMLLRIGSMSIIFIAFTQILTGVLQGLGQAHIPVKSAFIACLIKIPLNYVLIGIPFLNIYGAIISTTVIYMITTIINYMYIKNNCDMKLDVNGALFKPVASSAIMAVITYFSYKFTFIMFSSNFISIMISLAISVAVYFITLILIKGVNEEDLLSLPKGYKLLKILKSKNLI